jgi:probable O-glycosylation ligase (exosortase A-associated)
MKQTLLMIVLEILGTFGIVVGGPFLAVAVYYLFAVLRPQFLWQWALPPGIGWSEYPAIAAALGLVLYTFGVVPIDGRRQPTFLGLSPTHLAFLAFGTWTSLTYVTASNQAVSWPWLLEYLKIVTMFFIAALVIRTFTEVWILYLVATLPLLYVAYEVNSLYVFQGRLDIYHRGYGGLDNNGAALMLAMAIPLALNAWEGIRSRWRWLFVASIPFILHAVLLTYSRGAMVSLLAVTPVLIWRSSRRRQFIAVTMLLAAMLPFLAGREIRQRFFSVAQYQEDQSAESRFSSWSAAFHIANDYPIFGVGIRNANLFSYRYGADIENRTIHSQYLQILADEGYVGLLLYLFVLGNFFLGARRMRRALRTRADGDTARLLAMVNGLEASLAVFCVGGLFLSLEVFELPYLIVLIAAQTFVLPLPGVARTAVAPARTSAWDPARATVQTAFSLPSTASPFRR